MTTRNYRVFEAIRLKPGSTVNDIVEALKEPRKRILEAVQHLRRNESIETCSQKKPARYKPVDGAIVLPVTIPTIKQNRMARSDALKPYEWAKTDLELCWPEAR